MMNRVPITFIVPVYNEIRRIRSVLDHALQWADEIVIVDKGSTDGTLEVCRAHGDRVRIQSIPYSEQGDIAITLFPDYVSNDWVFLATCSEIPTRQLIEACRTVLDERGDQLDLIFVPRRMYAFGLHCSNPDWGVCHYPFLFHRRRARITNDVHDNFHADDPARTFRIPYTDTCCVHHLTYPTARAFWLASLQYFDAETHKDIPPDKAIRQCFKNIDRLSGKVLADGDNWIPFYCAFASYELGKALHIWEHARGKDVSTRLYGDLISRLNAREWSVTSDTPAISTPPAPAIVRIPGLQGLALFLARIPYLLFKFALLFRRK